MADQTVFDLKRRIQDLKAENRRLESENTLLHNLNVEQSSVIGEKSHIIETYEDLYGSIFTCFPRLPHELRNRIWQFSSPPRVITMYKGTLVDQRNTYRTYDPDTDSESGPQETRLEKRLERGDCWNACSYLRIPHISRVCKDSRNLFQREYIPVGEECQSYFNPLIDTIHVPKLMPDDLESLAVYMENKTLLKAGGMVQWGIRSLALENWVLPTPNPNIVYFILTLLMKYPDKRENLRLFDRFPKLKEVVFL